MKGMKAMKAMKMKSVGAAAVVLTVCALGFAAAAAGQGGQGGQAGQTGQGGPSVDDIIAKNIEAKGGLANLRSVQTMKQTSQMTTPQGPAGIVVYNKRPNLMREEISLPTGKVINGFDGRVAWIVNPALGTSTPMVISGPQADEIRVQSNFDGPLVDYKAQGYRVTLVGTETRDGGRFYHLRLTDPGQQVQDCYLDASTGLESQVVSTVNGAKLEQDLSDFRDVGHGLKMPFSIRMLVNGVQQSAIALEKVELNVSLDDALFKPPAR